MINTEIYKANDAEIKGAIGRVTGKDEDGVGRIFNTFKALCNYADFDIVQNMAYEEEKVNVSVSNESDNLEVKFNTPQFHYNIQIHLPAVNDISVYNAIFKSLKENLLM